MDKLSMLKQKFHTEQTKAILKVVVLIFATAMILIVAVWAWFASNESADADGLNVTMGTSKNLLISLDGGSTYHAGIDLMSDDAQAYIGETNIIKGKLSMQDITSDGKTFWRPVFNQIDTERIPDVTQNWSPAGTNTAYITQSIKFRTSFPAEIYMGAGTQIITKCQSENLSLTGASAGNKSSYGDFSKDCIVGALRISAIDSSNNLCFAMIPRSDLELVVNGDTYSVVTGTAVSDNAKQHTYYPSNYLETAGTVTNSSTLLGFTAAEGGSAPNDNTKIATTTFNEATGYYEAVATVNIWLEGCDSEAKRALSGGQYSIALDFVAFETGETVTQVTTEFQNWENID